MNALTRCGVIAACLLTAALALHAAAEGQRVPLPRPLAELPWSVGEWTGTAGPPLDRAVVSALGVDDFVNRAYSRGDQAVALYVGYYGSQAEGDRVHSPLNCLPGAGWEPVARRLTSIAVPDPVGRRGAATVQVNRLVIEKGLERHLVLYWYQSHGRVTASEYWGRALLVVDAVRLGRTDGALVRVLTPMGSAASIDSMSAEKAATSFVQAVFPVLRTFLPQ